MILVSGDEELRAFREAWTGTRILELLGEYGGRMRIDWAVGVGKSTSIDQTIEAAVRGGRYDLVLALFPTRRVIDERAWIKERPRGVKVVNLRPRPRKHCGKERDKAWQDFERRELGALGRITICGACPRRSGCFWPRQYGKHLCSARVIFGTQAHLERAPSFILQIASWTRADRILVLLDEANFIMKSYGRRIRHEDLVRFVEVLELLGLRTRSTRHREWAERCRLLLSATTPDLRDPAWQLRRFSTSWALAVQQLGVATHGDRFKFIAYDVLQFGYSPIPSRERDERGQISFAAPPHLNVDFVIYSGTAHPAFAAYRLGKDFKSPFSEYRFLHPETRWFNIASSLGTRRFFKKNAPQILDFFAGLVARRLKEGRRPLLVAKKCFVAECVAGLEDRFRDLGLGGVRVVTGNWSRVDLSNPAIVPLISFGTIGTNLFEQFDCAFCLTGYYVTEDVLDTVLQDLLASDCHIPLRIRTEGRPRRRTAGVRDAKDEFVDLHPLAQLALDQLEMDVVLQAVGRVRPYTRPREVITFQCGGHPQLDYTAEFNCLGEARSFFGIPSARARKVATTRARIMALKADGFVQRKAAGEIGISLSTIKRYWR